MYALKGSALRQLDAIAFCHNLPRPRSSNVPLILQRPGKFYAFLSVSYSYSPSLPPFSLSLK